MSTSDTPKTDAATQEEYEDLAYLSRQLERENNELRQLLGEAETALGFYGGCVVIGEGNVAGKFLVKLRSALKESQP